MGLRGQAKHKLLKLWLCFLAGSVLFSIVMKDLTIRVWLGSSLDLFGVAPGGALISSIDCSKNNSLLFRNKFKLYSLPSRPINLTLSWLERKWKLIPTVVSSSLWTQLVKDMVVDPDFLTIWNNFLDQLLCQFQITNSLLKFSCIQRVSRKLNNWLKKLFVCLHWVNNFFLINNIMIGVSELLKLFYQWLEDWSLSIDLQQKLRMFLSKLNASFWSRLSELTHCRS